MMENRAAQHYTESEIGKLRYELEHNVLKKRFFEMPEAVMNKLIAEYGAYSIYKNAFDQWGIVNPYKTSDFDIHVYNLENGGRCLCLELPYPEYLPICYRIYLLSDADYSKCAYYTIVRSVEGGSICEWRKDDYLKLDTIDPCVWPDDIKNIKIKDEARMVLNYFYNKTDAYTEQPKVDNAYTTTDTNGINSQAVVINGYAEQVINANRENIFLGIIGALIGSLAGVAAIVIFDIIGFVAALSGVAMAVCTFIMYEKFAGSISGKGVIVCVIVMLVMTLFAVNLAYSIQIVRELKDLGYQASIIGVFMELYGFIADGIISGETYVTSLAMTYGFTALGAFGTIKNLFNDVAN